MSLTARAASLQAMTRVSRGLADLNQSVTFVGGTTLCLYINDPVVGDVRHTEDVDCVLEIVGIVAWRDLEERLRRLGFVHHPTSNIICRWLYKEIVVDVMPASGDILGFTNRWYIPGIQSRTQHALPDGQLIWAFSFPYFFASKLEAVRQRGAEDLLRSKDMEDVVSVLDGRISALDELLSTTVELRSYIAQSLHALIMSRSDALEVIRGHLLPTAEHQQRAVSIYGMLRKLCAL